MELMRVLERLSHHSRWHVFCPDPAIRLGTWICASLGLSRITVQAREAPKVTDDQPRVLPDISRAEPLAGSRPLRSAQRTCEGRGQWPDIDGGRFLEWHCLVH